MTGARFFEPQ